ncbi:MAG: hypothetical protein ACR2RF_14760 [Geminicoccaceae bacterium]
MTDQNTEILDMPAPEQGAVMPYVGEVEIHREEIQQKGRTHRLSAYAVIIGFICLTVVVIVSQSASVQKAAYAVRLAETEHRIEAEKTDRAKVEVAQSPARHQTAAMSGWAWLADFGPWHVFGLVALIGFVRWLFK